MMKVVPKDYEDVCKFVGRIFANHEPMCKACNVSADDIVATFQKVIEACCSSNMSSIAKDATGAIISVCLALPFSTYKEIKCVQSDESIEPILDILDDLDLTGQLREIQKNVGYIFMIGTDPAHLNKGHTRALVHETLANMVVQLYTYAAADATNFISQHILINRFDFTVHKSILYAQYDAFKKIEDSNYLVRVVKYLD